MLKYAIAAPFCLLSSLAVAESFTLNSSVSAVTVYPSGAMVTRQVNYDLPAGRHDLVLSDIPEDAWVDSIQVKGGEGLVFGAIGGRDDRLPPDDRVVAARAEIEAQIEILKTEITAKQQEQSAVQLRISASQARLRFLESIGQQQAAQAGGALDNGVLSIETLTQLVDLIGNQSLLAHQESHAAQVEIAALSVEINDMQNDLKDLFLNLEAAGLPPYPRQMVNFDVAVDEAVSGVFQMSYLVQGGNWRPVYDVHLNTETSGLRLERKAIVTQYSGEDWVDVAISLSTSRPSYQTQMVQPYGQRLQYSDRRPETELMRNAGSDMMASIAPAPMVMEDSVAMVTGVDFQGVNALYHLPAGTRINGDGSESLVNIDTSEFIADLTAQVNLTNSTSAAFLIAEFTNASNQIILPGNYKFYRDGAYSGSEQLELMIAPGVTESLGFGIVDGIEARLITRNYQDGQSGVLTTSNERIAEYELRIENRSGRKWDTVVYGRVPYSEQENLTIDFSSRPRPNVVDYDDLRGVLAWTFPLEDSETTSIMLEYKVGWPDGKILR